MGRGRDKLLDQSGLPLFMTAGAPSLMNCVPRQRHSSRQPFLLPLCAKERASFFQRHSIWDKNVVLQLGNLVYMLAPLLPPD